MSIFKKGRMGSLVFLGILLLPSLALAAPLQMVTGYYVGTGATTTITGLGFEPEFILIKSDTNAGSAVYKTASMPAPNTSFVTATADNTGTQIAFASDGFTIGTLANVNTANVRYTYVAFSGSDCSAAGEFCEGFYIGDGTASREITTGFAPALVLTKRTAVSTAWLSNAMPALTGQYLDGTAQNVTGGLFQGTSTTGFLVGTTTNVNLSVYYYVALKEVSGKVDVGSYAGDSVDGKSIATAFAPDVAFVKATSTASGVFSTAHSYGDYSSFMTATANAVNHIQSLSGSAFTVGNSANVNITGNSYYWFAFGGASTDATSGVFDYANGSYTGTGIAQAISGLSFTPDLVIIKHNDQATDQHAVFRTKTMAGNTTAYLANGVANFAGGVTALDATGFTVGTHATVNTAGDTYYWSAFGNAYNPYTRSGASDFTVGAYTGNGLDARDIADVPFSPDLLSVKQTGAAVAPYRTSEQGGDFSLFYGATAGAADYIQDFNSDGFEVGTNAAVNGAGALHHYFAFEQSPNFVVETYTGTGATSSIVAGLAPGLLWIKSPAVAGYALMRTSAQSGDASQPFTNVPTQLGGILSLDASGFTVGTTTQSNSNSVVYTYALWGAPDTIDPTVSLSYSPSTVRKNDDVTITATFSEPIADSPVMKISFSGAQTLASSTMTKISSTVYEFEFIAGNSTGVVSVLVGDGTDVAGNDIVSVPTAGATFTITQASSGGGGGGSSGGGSSKKKTVDEEIAENVVITTENTEVITETIQNGFQFTRALTVGDMGDDVSRLQTILKNLGTSTYPEGLVTGYFGQLTKAAVARYQNAYKDVILTPIGLVTGTGYFGTMTMNHMNSLINSLAQ
jgi:hypothetical protein